MISSRNGYGTLNDPTKFDDADMLAMSPERATLHQAWCDAEIALKESQAQCDEAALMLSTAQSDRNELVRLFGSKFSISFMDQHRAMKALGRR